MMRKRNDDEASKDKEEVKEGELPRNLKKYLDKKRQV
ncbi:MAG: hypothetical protein CM15mV18_1160 [uncultured marine virus]|nr:MAG: hypothetical protein CM15mV18_1160 [uncultured marine virus]